MAFGRDKLTKQDLIDAGLDPDKLKEFQEKGVTKEHLDALKTELTASINTTITDQIKAGFTELEGKLRTPVRKETEGDGDGINKEEDANTEFMTDPTGYINKQVGKLGAAAAVEIMKTKRSIAVSNAKSTLKGFTNETLRTEIMKELDEKYSADKLVRFGSEPDVIIQMVHDMVLGRHQDEIMQDSQKREGKYNLVHSGGSGGNVTNNNNNGGDNKGGKRTLSDEEKVVAKKFGMSDDEWLQQEVDSEKEELQRRKGGTVLV